MATLLVNQMPPSACPVQQQVLPQGWRAEYEQSSGQWYYVNTYTNATQWDLPANPAGQGPNTRPVEPHSIPSAPHDPNQTQDRGLFSPSSKGEQPKGFLGRVLQGKPPFQLSQQLRNLVQPPRPASFQAQPTYGPPQGQRPQSMRPQQGYPPPQQGMSSPRPPAQAQGNRMGMGKLLGIGAGGGLLGGLFADKATGSWSSQQGSVAPPMNPSNDQYSYGGQGGYDQGYYNSTSASPGQGLGTTQDSYAPMGYGQGGGYSQGGYNGYPDGQQQQQNGYDQQSGSNGQGGYNNYQDGQQQQQNGYDQQSGSNGQGGGYSQGGYNNYQDGQQQQQNGYDQQGGGYSQGTDYDPTQSDQQGGYDQGYDQQDDNYQQQMDSMDAQADADAIEAQGYENAAELI